MERDGFKFYFFYLYDVYGFFYNLFEQFVSEGIVDVESIYVYQEVDMCFQMIILEVFGYKSFIVFSIVGLFGMGKIQRFKNIVKVIEDNGGKVIYVKVDINDILKFMCDIFYVFKLLRSRMNIFFENFLRKLGFIDRFEKMLSDLNEYKSRDIVEFLVE